MPQVLIHVRCNKAGKVRREKMNGREVIIVPSATMPDDVVMNDILYPAKEIEASFASLDRTPAPLGHPTINGKFVSARDPEGINIGWVGAFNTNVRREKGRILLDKVIDVERANQSEEGRRVLNAIEKGDPIHTSTGLLTELEAANGEVEHKFIARNMVFDHDAILLDEDGAATPEQGVGMMVNAKGEEIEVINASLPDMDDLDWAVEAAVSALERRSDERKNVIERIKSAIMEAFRQAPERGTTTANRKESKDMDDKQFEELSAKVNTLSEGFDKMGETIATTVAEAVKPLVDAQAEMVANQKAKDDAELADLQAKIVKANLLDEDAAGELTLNAARALAKKAEPGKAAALNGAYSGNDDGKGGFKLPAADKKEA
ncbi:hypothetical protein [Pelagibius sp.]|uniref:hypothetical protein n=1 Tax=Pelagibius sp. TaxID=1931238 RepID=UPI003BB14EC4